MGNGIATIVVAASVGTSIGIDASLKSESMDVIDHALQPARETLRMDEQLTRLWVTSSEITIVDVDVLVASILQRSACHHIGLVHYDRVTDVERKGVP